MNTLDLLDRPIAFHRVFVTITGSIHAALLLSQAVYWTKRTSDADGWFWKTADQWEDETGMGRYEIQRARKRLIGLGLIDYRVKGQPARSFYRVLVHPIRAAFKGEIRELSIDQIIHLYEVELAQLSAAGFMRATKMGRKAERVQYAEVLRKYGNICHRCKEPITLGVGQSGRFLVFDHVKALAAGGEHVLVNLRPMHAKCNSQKSHTDKEDADLFSFLGANKLVFLGQENQPASDKQPTNSTETTSKSTLDSRADEVYQAYPRKVGKPAALLKIKKAIKLIGFEPLLEKTRAFAAAWNGSSEMEFCPHPSTWFNQQRFNDDPSTWSRNGTHRKSDTASNRNTGTANAGRAGQYKGAGQVSKV